MTKGREKSRKTKKGKQALIGRVKKAVKKSRRQFDDDVRFRKELKRTIKVLEEIQAKINHGPAAPKRAAQSPAASVAAREAAAKPRRGAAAKAGKK